MPGKKELVKEEKKTSRFAFASVVSIKDIAKGEIFSKKNIWVKRPEMVIFQQKNTTVFLEKKSLSSIKKNTQIKNKHVKKKIKLDFFFR